jgi:uncharacterized caspase-like protein
MDNGLGSLKLFGCLTLMSALLAGANTEAFAQGATRGLAPETSTSIVSTDLGQLYKKTHALIIGIDNYPEDSGCNPLEYAARDAQGIATTLQERYDFDEVTTLLNEEASLQGILAAFDSLQSLGEDDAFFLFWAGHGVTERTRFDDMEIGYLVPHSGSCSSERFLQDNLSMETLKNVIARRIPAKHQLFIVDACYGGLLTTRSGAEQKPRRSASYLNYVTSQVAAQIITAGTSDQTVLDGGPDNHSVFAGWILRELGTSNDYVTGLELYHEVHDKVFNDAQTRNHLQTPQYGKYWGNGDFVFVLKEEARTSQTNEGAAAPAPEAFGIKTVDIPPAFLLGDKGTITVELTGGRASCTVSAYLEEDGAWREFSLSREGEGSRWSGQLELELSMLPTLRYYVVGSCDGRQVSEGSETGALQVRIL